MPEVAVLRNPFPRPLPRLAWWLYGLALLVAVLDLATKAWASAALDYGQPLVFTSFFNFTLWHNEGAAFSFLAGAGGWQRWFFTVVAVVFSAVLLVWIARSAATRRLEAVALTLILGGALGNLYDRVTLGYVVDFIVFHYEDRYFPAFNVADMAISTGAGLFIFDILFGKSGDRDRTRHG